MSDRLGAALKQAGKAKVRRRRKRSDAGKKRGPKVKVEPVASLPEDEVVLPDSPPEAWVDEPRMTHMANDRASVLSGLGMSEGTFSAIFPQLGDYMDDDDFHFIESKLGLAHGVLGEAIAMDLPVYIEGVVLPIALQNQRLCYVRNDRGDCDLVQRKIDSCRHGQRVLVKDGIIVRVLR
jgi:hypothetical protein